MKLSEVHYNGCDLHKESVVQDLPNRWLLKLNTVLVNIAFLIFYQRSMIRVGKIHYLLAVLSMCKSSN